MARLGLSRQKEEKNRTDDGNQDLSPSAAIHKVAEVVDSLCIDAFSGRF